MLAKAYLDQDYYALTVESRPFRSIISCRGTRQIVTTPVSRIGQGKLDLFESSRRYAYDQEYLYLPNSISASKGRRLLA